MKNRTIWVHWSAFHRQAPTEQCRAFRAAAATSVGHTWSEHFDVEVDILVLEARRARQKRSRLDLRMYQGLALDAIIGPIVASAARVASVRTSRRWCREGEEPGCLITIREHEPNSRPDGPESEKI